MKGILKTDTSLKVIRIVIFTLLIVTFVRGAIGMFKINDSKKVKEEFTESLNETIRNIDIKNNVSSFAERFGIAYLTYSEENAEEYRLNLNKYVTDNVLSSMNTKFYGSSEVLSSIAIDIKEYKENFYNVDLYIEYKVNDKLSTSYIRVPVAINIKSGEFAIDDIPLFIAEPSRATVEKEVLNRTLTDKSIQDEINIMMSNFLKTYYQGSNNELNYYLESENTGKINVVKGEYEFATINNLSAYSTDKENIFNVVVDFTIKDKEGNQEFKQKISAMVVKDSEKYFIRQFNTRDID